jgi:hypothetical protein
MKRLNISLFIICLLLNSCSQAKQQTKQSIKLNTTKNQNSHVNDFSKLIYKSKLSDEEKSYIKTKADEFNKKLRSYAVHYGEKSDLNGSQIQAKELCKWIIKNTNDLSDLPVSQERERERERESLFYSKECNYEELGSLKYSVPSQFWEIVEEKIPNSAQPYIEKANQEIIENNKKRFLNQLISLSSF